MGCEHCKIGRKDLLGENSDIAFTGAANMGIGYEPTYSGALSLFRRLYSKDISKADMVFWGIPYDLSVTNRPGTRFGPRGIRAAATNLAWEGGPWPWGFDPFETLNAVDYGDCYFDPGHPMDILEAIFKEASDILAHDPFLISMGGDHSVAYPLIKAVMPS